MPLKRCTESFHAGSNERQARFYDMSRIQRIRQLDHLRAHIGPITYLVHLSSFKVQQITGYFCTKASL